MKKTNVQQNDSYTPEIKNDSITIPIKSSHLFWLLMLATFIIILLLVLGHHILPWVHNFSYPNNIQDFSNQFIPINILFTGLAFAGLIITIMLQQSACKQLSDQQKTLKQQMLETSFYNQLHHLLNLIDNTHISFYRMYWTPLQSSGHCAISQLFDYVEAIGRKLQLKQKLSSSEEETLRNADNSISPFLKSFFSFAYIIIDNKDISAEKREQYAGLFSDSLTFKEAYILGIYGRTYQYNHNHDQMQKVLEYFDEHRLWQKNVIHDVFGSPANFAMFAAIVNRDNKDHPS